MNNDRLPYRLYNTEFDCMRYFYVGGFIVDSETGSKICKHNEESNIEMQNVAIKMNIDFLDYTALVLEYCGYKISKFNETVYVRYTIY